MENHLPLLTNIYANMKKKKETAKQKMRREAREFEASLRGMTKEEIIAANKARVAKLHPEPDFSTISPQYLRALQKLKHEKTMMEKAKKLWFSVVSVPMGGRNK